jgi:hypothetical protein
MAKRRGEHGAVAAIWEGLLDHEEFRATACEELAIYYERRMKNFAKALEYARSGLAALNRKASTSRYESRATADLRRIERLTKRITRLERRVSEGCDQTPLLRRSRATAAGD